MVPWIGHFFQFSFFIPYTYISPYAISLGFDPSFSGLALAMLGVGSVCGRLIFGPIADRFGRLCTYRVNMIFATIALAVWPACTTESSILAFTFFYGAFGGGFAAMFAVVAAELWGPERLSALFTLVNLCGIPGAFASGPVFGIIVEESNNLYGPAMGFTAGMVVISSILVMFVRKPKTHPAGTTTTITSSPPTENKPYADEQQQQQQQQLQPSSPENNKLIDLEANIKEEYKPPQVIIDEKDYLARLKAYHIDPDKVAHASEEERQNYIRALQFVEFRETQPNPPDSIDAVFTRVLNGLQEAGFDVVRGKVKEHFGTIPVEWQYVELK